MEYSKKFSGIFPAVVTPFTGSSEIDFKAFEKLAGHLYNSNVQGLFVGGNMGEWYTQTLEERKRVADLALKISKGVGKVILHAGSTRLEDAIELARYGEKIGVDAIASLPPYHARLTEADVVSYYRQLAQATQLPFFIYHHPGLTGYQMNSITLEMMESLPNMAGIKYTDYDLLNYANLIEFKNRGLCIMNGHDQVLFPGLSMGASGGIGSFYNVIPKAFTRLYGYTREGNMDAARQLQQQINQFIQVVKKYSLIPALKYILHLNDIGTGNFRVSIVPLSPNDKKQLEHALDENSFYNEWKIGRTGSFTMQDAGVS